MTDKGFNIVDGCAARSIHFIIPLEQEVPLK